MQAWQRATVPVQAAITIAAQYDTLAGMNSDEDKKLKTSLDFVLSVGMHSRITSKPLRTQCAKSFFQSVGIISVKPLAAHSGYPVLEC
jgi:hypothetical protein